MSSSNLINRETLANGTIRQMALDRDGPDSAILTEEELLESRRSFFPDDYDKDVWLFGYGSLIWNPVVEVKEKTLGRIYGYHRRFCLKTRIGRGSVSHRVRWYAYVNTTRNNACASNVLTRKSLVSPSHTLTH